MKAPHFVGTFDAFINRFIARPLYVHYYDRTPRFIESWRDTKHSSFRLPDMDRLPDMQLDWFMFDWATSGQLRATLEDAWIPPVLARSLKGYITANRARLQEQAVIRCRTLVTRNGLLSCAASRAMVTGQLQHPAWTQRFGDLLANRFSEVIIDEAQDCGPEELAILTLLKNKGVTLVAVADLDQSIYGFRRADPDGVQAFIRELGTPLPLNGNYRSSPTICALNNSLRSGTRAETARGDNASCELPVLLLGYRRQDDVAGAVDALLTARGRPRGEAVVLAHRESDARACAGTSRDRDTRSTQAIPGIAWAHSILRSGSPASADRLRAVRVVERVIRVAASCDDEDEDALDERWLRDAAYRLASSLDPAGSTAKAYAQAVREYVKQIPWPASITPKDNLGAFLKAPPELMWPTPGKEASAGLLFATIHSVKGREFPTAVVVLPRNLHTDANDQNVLDHWEHDKETEARRVLYVGASRAQTLLILAVHTHHANRVAGLLQRDGVPYNLLP